MRSVGIYPGTFDPIHDGHIAFAEAARREYELEKVVFFPENAPRGKIDVTNLERRLAYIKARIDDAQALETRILRVARFDVESTLSLLEDMYPDARLVLLMGSDVAMRLAEWPEVERLLARVEIVVGMRTGDDEAVLAASLEKLGGAIHFLRTDKAHVSSRMYRTQNGTGEL